MANDAPSDAGDSPRADGLARVTPDEAIQFKILSKEEEGAQPSLFPVGELLAPKGLTKYRKGIAALHSVPAPGEKSHTLNSRRVMDAIAVLVQIDFRKRPKHQVDMLREMEASPMFRVTKGELRKLAGIASKNFDRVENVLELLHDMKIHWNVLGEDASIEWRMKSRFLASYGVGVGRYEDMVCFSIDPRVLNLILEPRFWATLTLDVLHQLHTESSYSLYQHAWRYIGTENKVTAPFPVATWIDLLMGESRYVQTEANGEKRVVDYSEWKKRYLLPAIQKVNNVSALSHTLELVEIRSGLKVKRIQFRFVAKRQEKLDLPLTWPDDIAVALKNIDFTEDEIAEMAQGFSLDEVVESFTRYKDADERIRRKHQRISSPKAFFNGILNNVATQAALDDEQLEVVEKKARAEDALKLSKDRQDRAERDFSQRQTKRMVESLAEWPADRRENLLADFETSADYARSKALFHKGWERPSMGAWTIFKTWLIRERPVDVEELLPNPEDRTMEAWLVWRLDNPAADAK